jgi:pimeloyl-ACP methyl ester carboxylesterase
VSAPTKELVLVDENVELSCLEWRPHDSGAAHSATPILLVHGLASNAHLWDGVARRLAESGRHVVAVDQRGHGLSSKPTSGFDFGTLTRDLLDVISQYGWYGADDSSPDARPPFVAGQSWGANVVLELAARYPESVSGIALVDGGTGDLADSFADWPTCQAALAPPVLEGMGAKKFESLIRSSHPDWPEEGIHGTIANVEIRADGTIRPWLSRENHMTILRQLWEHHPSKRFADVPVPVLIVPADDPSNQRWSAGKRDSVKRAVESLPCSVAHWLVGDHDLHAQYPIEVADLIDSASRPGFFV